MNNGNIYPMDNKKKYDSLIAEIRSADPLLEDGEAITSHIMNKIKIGDKIETASRVQKIALKPDASRAQSLHGRLISAGRLSLAASILLAVPMISELRVSASTTLTNHSTTINIHDYTDIYKGMHFDDVVNHMTERRQMSNAIISSVNLRRKNFPAPQKNIKQ